MRFLLTALCSLLLTLSAFLAGSTSSASQDAAPSVAAKVKLPPGYLQMALLPDSLALLPAPPEAGSAAFARDEAAQAEAQTLKGTARWTVAISDADLKFPHSASTFACAAGIAISKEATPRLYGLLGRMLVDVGLSTYRAKDNYKRIRPFVVHKQETCTPDEDKFLMGDGSYPSGHSAVGWGWALVLTEVVPSRADAILQRGREFGHSRVVCNAHWQSDVEAGRMIASSTVARLHAEAAFAADLAAAKAEVARAGQAAYSSASCDAETKALAPALGI